tara:strand:- start:266 stop:541 length:276 start_codon:yes stop_codon:yes gene_type:complete
MDMTLIDTNPKLVRDFLASEVSRPGKFEGCEIYAPFYYDCMLDGDGEELDDGCLRFDVRSSEVKMFPELANTKYVDLYEDDNGFVYTSLAS